MNWRSSLWLAVVALGVVAPTGAKAPADYPYKPIRLIIPAIPGTPPDLVGRVIGERFAQSLGQPLILENKPGATGMIGLQALAAAAPDGYTLGMIAMPYLVMGALVSKVPYDTEKAFAPVTLTNWQYSLLAVPAGSPHRSVADIIAAAKAQPGALKFSSSGNGTPAHIAGKLFQHDTGSALTHVPYKGAPAAVAALLSGEVDMSISAAGALSPHIKAGKVRALVTTAPHRISAYPELPTFAELGYPAVQIQDWQGVIAPAGTPTDVVELLHTTIARTTSIPAVKERLEALGMEIVSAGPEQFAAHLRSEIVRWGALVRDVGLKIE